MDFWSQVLEASSPVTPNAPGQAVEPDEEKLKARREFLARIMKKALRKSSNTSEDDVGDGDETDDGGDEQLPHDQDSTLDKRTPTKRKKSAVQLVDDKKGEQQSSQSQSSEPPKQQPQQRHHQHRQPLPRKLSFMQLREIAETSHQTADEIKPIESISAIVESKATEENAHDDEYNKVNVVSERRALRRQQNARESEGSISLQMSFPDTATNYDIVNEKPKPVEKPPRTKSPLQRNSPEIFKFDTKSVKSNDDSEMEPKAMSVEKSPKTNSSPTDLQSKNPSPTASLQLHSPNDIELNPSSSASTPQKSGGESRKQSSHSSSSPQQSPLPSEKTSSKHSGDDILNKPIRKLNSFLALVKEAVHSKKSDQPQQPPPPQTPPAPAPPPPPPQQQQQQDIQIDVSPSHEPPPHDHTSRVRLFIDDSNSVSMSESIKTTTDTQSVTSSKLTCYESLRRLRHADQPKPKRQDSQASIWSENIPVITISKSESNECILERDNDDAEHTDSKN